MPITPISRAVSLALAAAAMLSAQFFGAGGGTRQGYDKATFEICVTGPCATGTDLTPHWLQIHATATVRKCYVTAKTVPTTGPLTVDIKKNGATSIFTTPFSLVAGAFYANTTAVSASLVEGDFLSINILAANAAASVTVTCELQAPTQPAGGGSGTGTVTSAALTGTANQIIVTGPSPITSAGAWHLSLPTGLQLPYLAGTFNASATEHSTPVGVGIGAPSGLCMVGEIRFRSDAAPGQNLYFCTGSGIGDWTQMVANVPHATTHAAGSTDPLTPAAIGAPSLAANNVFTGTQTIGSAVLDATWGVKVAMTTATGALAVSSGGFIYCNAVSCVFTLPAITTAMVADGQSPRWCFFQDDGRSGVLRINAPASATFSLDGSTGASPGYITSAGALGDSVCVVARSTTKLHAISGVGTWTNH